MSVPRCRAITMTVMAALAAGCAGPPPADRTVAAAESATDGLGSIEACRSVVASGYEARTVAFDVPKLWTDDGGVVVTLGVAVADDRTAQSGPRRTYRCRFEQGRLVDLRQKG